MKFSPRRRAVIEPLDPRLLYAVNNATADLIRLDDLRAKYPALTGGGQVIAMIDTGVNYNLSQLGGGFGAGKKVIAGYDFVDNDADPMDTDGHGTAVAGVIAASEYAAGGKTYSGIAPDAKLVVLRVAEGETGISNGTIEEALQWVIANRTKYGISVVNLSLGGGEYTADPGDQTTGDEYQTLADAGVFVTAASGNDGETSAGNDAIAYPAADDNVFAAGSVNDSGVVSTYTQRGNLVDLLAPGEDITALSLTAGSFASISGTSFSSPMVAGAAALLRQAAGTIGANDIASALVTSGVNTYDGDNETGRTTERTYERLDLFAAVAEVRERFNNASKTLAAGVGTVLDSAVDRAGILHVAYYDAATADLMYTTRNQSGTWGAPQRVDGSGTDTGRSLSIAVSPGGQVGIAYFDATQADLKYAALDGGQWSTRRVDRPKNVGSFSSLVFDDAGNPVIAYYALSGRNLKLATYVRSVDSFARQTLDSAGDVGAYASLAYNLTNDGTSVLAVAYSDRTNGDLKYARYGTGGFGNVWETFVAADTDGVANISLGLTTGQAQIAYQSTAAGDIRFAYRANSVWNNETIATTGALGNAVSLYYDGNYTPLVAYYNRTKGTVSVATTSAGILDTSSRTAWSVTPVAVGGRALASAGGVLLYLDDAGDVLTM